MEELHKEMPSLHPKKKVKFHIIVNGTRMKKHSSALHAANHVFARSADILPVYSFEALSFLLNSQALFKYSTIENHQANNQVIVDSMKTVHIFNIYFHIKFKEFVMFNSHRYFPFQKW